MEHLKALQGDEEWEPTVFHADRPMVWTFRSNSPTLIEKGCAPGALFVSIDKLDGHRWTMEEFDAHQPGSEYQN